MAGVLENYMAKPSIYQPELAEIVEIRPITEMEKLFKIRLPAAKPLNHRPGQFVMISVLGIGEAPISITSSPSRSSDIFEICVRRTGSLTNALHRLEAGAKIGVRGPFGNGFPMERLNGRDVLLIPGGLGLAPLRSLINQILDNRQAFGRFIILYGAKNPSELLFQDEIEGWQSRDDIEILVTVDKADEGWTGNVGVVTTLFQKINIVEENIVAVTVGPPVMYRFVIAELLGLGKGVDETNIWLSLERRMKCGVGKCGHCQMNHIYVCQEGPCFSYHAIKNVGEAL